MMFVNRRAQCLHTGPALVDSLSFEWSGPFVIPFEWSRPVVKSFKWSQPVVYFEWSAPLWYPSIGAGRYILSCGPGSVLSFEWSRPAVVSLKWLGASLNESELTSVAFSNLALAASCARPSVLLCNWFRGLLGPTRSLDKSRANLGHTAGQFSEKSSCNRFATFREEQSLLSVVSAV